MDTIGVKAQKRGGTGVQQAVGSSSPEGA